MVFLVVRMGDHHRLAQAQIVVQLCFVESMNMKLGLGFVAALVAQNRAPFCQRYDPKFAVVVTV